MKRHSLVVLVMSAVGIAALGALAVPPDAPAPAAFALHGDVENGRKLFVVNCASCHGKKGAGDGIAGKALAPPPASFSDVKRFKDVTDWELYTAVKSGGPAVKLAATMPPWSPALKDQEINDVVTYVKTALIEPARKKETP